MFPLVTCNKEIKGPSLNEPLPLFHNEPTTWFNLGPRHLFLKLGRTSNIYEETPIFLDKNMLSYCFISQNHRKWKTTKVKKYIVTASKIHNCPTQNKTRITKKEIATLEKSTEKMWYLCNYISPLRYSLLRMFSPTKKLEKGNSTKFHMS